MPDQSPAYYAAHVHGKVVIVQSGPHPSGDEAMGTHKTAAAAEQGSPTAYWRRAVLLDMDSVPVDEDSLAVLLEHDPTLRAIYEYGLQHGRMLQEIHEDDRRAALDEDTANVAAAMGRLS